MISYVRMFELQRHIFGVCPKQGELFRLSDCRVYLKTRPKDDWMDNYQRESERIDAHEERLANDLERIREAARVRGRKAAERVIRAVDRIFRPKRLNPDDAKVLFHPVDFVVFNGMKGKGLRSIKLLDRRERPSPEQRKAQKSVERAVERQRYEWLTLRVSSDGSIAEN